MRLAVFSHKPCWRSVRSVSGYATDGGFPFQIAAISELFDETRLLVPVSPEGGVSKSEIPLSGQNLRVVPLTPRVGQDAISKLTFLPWLLRNSGRIAAELRWADAVHAPVPGDLGTVGLTAALLLRKPLFVRYCGNWLTEDTSADRVWHWLMERWAGGRNVMLATGGSSEPPSSRTQHIHWIFSTTLTRDELRELGRQQPQLNDPAPRIITVGRQERGKGTGTLLAALPLIRKRLPKASLDVVGEGSEIPALKREVAALGLEQIVRFHGKVRHSEVIRLLRLSQVFCFPTHSEGFPKAVLEALACGLPVVATAVSVLPSLLSGGAGKLVNADPEQIAEAICDVTSAPEIYRGMSQKAQEIAQQYSLENWRNAIGSYLESAWGPLRTERA